jgi:succinyldiaminopimelate transaminase
VDLIDFSIGDPREPTPETVRTAVRDAIPEVSQYPTVRGLRELREAIAGYVERRCGVAVDPDSQVLPTAGSKEAIFSTPLALIDRDAGDAVVWPTPGYPIYERGALLAGAVGRPVALRDDFLFRPGMVQERDWSRARMVWICSPHNPAGSVMTRADIEGFVARARESDTLLCSDECYLDLYQTDPPTSALEVAGPDAGGVLTFFSLSKRSGMTGYRSGAMVGDPEVISLLGSFRTSIGTASPEFIQAGAIAAWSDDSHVAERRAIFAAKRAVLRRAFEEAGFAVVGSTAGIYLWIDVGDDVGVTERLLAANIVVSPGRAFGPGGEGHIRLALVPTLADCDQAAEAVLECLSES